jgi:hypothetical protein
VSSPDAGGPGKPLIPTRDSLSSFPTRGAFPITRPTPGGMVRAGYCTQQRRTQPEKHDHPAEMAVILYAFYRDYDLRQASAIVNRP